MGCLAGDFSAAFGRDLKKKDEWHGWELSQLERAIDLEVESSPEAPGDFGGGATCARCQENRPAAAE